jgi:hypothetical protein
MVKKCLVCDEENPDEAEKCSACGSLFKGEKDFDKKEVKSGKVLLSIFTVVIIIMIGIVIAPMLYTNISNNTSSKDGDGDNIPDQWEEEHNLNPDDPTDRNEDPDNDGLTNYEEYRRDTDPHNDDTDSDGILDGWDLIPKQNAGIRVTIENVRVRDYVDGIWPLQKNTGQIFFRIYVNNSNGEIPTTGPEEMEIDKDISVNWSVQYDIPDDEPYHTIRIEMYDKDTIGEELLDINGLDSSKPPNNRGYYIEIRNYYIHEIGQFINWDDPRLPSSDGFDDGNSGLFDDKDGMIEYRVTTVEIAI